MQTEIIYRLPQAAETLIVCCLGIAVASLAVWLVVATFNRLQNDALRLEIMRSKKEIKALNNWQKAYEDEKALHIQDVADLINKLEDERYLNAENMKEADREINDLLRQIREKDALLKLAKVADL